MTIASDPKACVLCASEQTRGAFPHTSRLERCTTCGLVSTSERHESPYGPSYFADGGYHSYFARAGQWRHEARRRLRWLLEAASPSAVVEIGCAGGFFLEAARTAGILAVGVEPSRVAADFAVGALDVPVILGRFEDTDLERAFDAVCAFHVLEHVDDPLLFLERARALTAAGGWLALEVPNIDSAAARTQGVNWPGLQPEYHRWHFSPRTLTSLVGKAGFRVIRRDTVFTRFYSRPAARLRRTPSDLRMAVRARSLRAIHPTLGDHIRLLARPLP